MNVLAILGISRAAGMGFGALVIGLAAALGLRLLWKRAKEPQRTLIDLSGR
jgi:hypothetical protein